MTALKEYLKASRGRGSELARELGVTPAAISQWADSQVPAERIFKLSEITNIPIGVLRPDLIPTASGKAA